MDDLVSLARSYVANNAESGADSLILDLADEVERLRGALQEIADDPCLDPEGNRQIALRALNNWPEAWDEGFVAHMHGEPVGSNPYQHGTEARRRWSDGWMDREQHQQNKAECFPGW